MKLHTCSEVVSLARNLETESAKLYERLAKDYPEQGALFASYAQENRKNIVIVERAYYGVITDAIEGCFAFQINPEDYVLDATVAPIMKYPEAIKKAISIEDNLIRYYTDAAEQGKSLMADMPRAFAALAKKRLIRRESLQSRLDSGATT